MRLSIFAVLLIQGASFSFAGTLPPLSVKEISLMLRSGYSVEAVHREVQSRHFVEVLDSAGETSLLQAGATTVFIAALKSGAHGVPPAELAAVQAELATKAQRRAAQVEETQKLNTLRQAQIAQQLAATPVPTTNAIAALVKGDLVASSGGQLSPFVDAGLEKKRLIGLYFSAGWCGPCRKFTPELVAFYNKNAAAHPEFEILFVSSDKSAPAMERYMRDQQMPWPAVSFDKLPGKEAIRKYSGSGIPCLVIVDASGKVISDTYAGETYRGPKKVLSDLEGLLATGNVGQVALTR